MVHSSEIFPFPTSSSLATGLLSSCGTQTTPEGLSRGSIAWKGRKPLGKDRFRRRRSRLGTKCVHLHHNLLRAKCARRNLSFLALIPATRIIFSRDGNCPGHSKNQHRCTACAARVQRRGLQCPSGLLHRSARLLASCYRPATTPWRITFQT